MRACRAPHGPAPEQSGALARGERGGRGMLLVVATADVVAVAVEAAASGTGTTARVCVV